MQNDLHITPLKGLLIVLAGSLLISIGIWHCSVPFGDEAGYISRAMGLVSKNEFTFNLYILNYEFLLKFISPDPIVVHTLCRFYTSILSCIFMYLFLTSFKFLKNYLAILVVCAFWACCRLNIPYSQFGNNNLFCLNLMFPSLILLMRKITVNRAIFFILSLLWVAQIRPEYYAPLLLSVIYFIGMIIYRTLYKKRKVKLTLKTKQIVTVFLICSIPISLLCFEQNKKKENISLDKYLLLGLEQCYTSLYSKLHPEEKISAMVEYKNVTDKAFNKPEGFWDACKKNPIKVTKYLTLNGSLNSIILIPALLRHRNLFMPESLGKKGEIVELALILIILLYGTIIGVNGLKQGSEITRNNILKFLLNPKMIILVLFVSSSFAAIMLLIPDARYWISWIPIVFLWMAWSVSQIYKKIHSKPTTIIVSFVLFIWFCYPLFGRQYSNQLLIREMRKERKEYMLKPKVTGLSPTGISTFAFGLDVEVLTIYNLNTLKIKNEDFDFIIINKYLRNSAFWAENDEFMVKFEQNPGAYGYKFLGASQDKHQTMVYAKKY